MSPAESLPIPAAPPQEQPATPDPLHQAIAAIVTPLAGPLVANLAADVKTDIAGVQSDVVDVQDAIQGLQTAADSHGGLIGGLQTLADTHSTQIAALEGRLSQAGGAVIQNIETDQTTQRYLVLGVCGAVLLGAAAVLVAALFGNHEALKWVAAAPGAAIAVVLWVSNSGGLSLPARTKPAPVGPPTA